MKSQNGRKIKVIKTENYRKCYEKLDKSIQKQIDKQEKFLFENRGRGKPLHKNLFERKVQNYRIYYLRKKNGDIVLVFISIHKKTGNKGQQEEINKIIKLLEINDFQL